MNDEEIRKLIEFKKRLAELGRDNVLSDVTSDVNMRTPLQDSLGPIEGEGFKMVGDPVSQDVNFKMGEQLDPKEFPLENVGNRAAVAGDVIDDIPQGNMGLSKVDDFVNTSSKAVPESKLSQILSKMRGFGDDAVSGIGRAANSPLGKAAGTGLKYGGPLLSAAMTETIGPEEGSLEAELESGNEVDIKELLAKYQGEDQGEYFRPEMEGSPASVLEQASQVSQAVPGMPEEEFKMMGAEDSEVKEPKIEEPKVKESNDVSPEQEKEVKQAEKEFKSPIGDLMKELRDLKKSDQSDLDGARKMQGIMSGISDIMKGLDKYTTAKSGGGLAVLKGNKDAGKSFQDMGDRGVLHAKEDIALRKDRKKELAGDIEMSSKMDAMDPNSSRSKMYTQLVGSRLSEKLGIDVDLTGLSAQDAIKLSQSIGQLGAVKDPQDAKLKRELVQSQIDNYKAREGDYQSKQSNRDEIQSTAKKELAKRNAKMRRFNELYKEADFASLFANRMDPKLATLGKNDPERTAFISKIGEEFASYIKEKSGTAASDAEVARLSKNMLNENFNADTFKAIAARIYQDDLKNSLSELEVYKRAGDTGTGKLESMFTELKDTEIFNHGKAKEAPHGELVERSGKKYKWNGAANKYQLYGN